LNEQKNLEIKIQTKVQLNNDVLIDDGIKLLMAILPERLNAVIYNYRAIVKPIKLTSIPP
jgi:hypothetical protein